MSATRATADPARATPDGHQPDPQRLPGTVPITFDNVETRNFSLSGGVINILGTPAGTKTTVNAGGGSDRSSSAAPPTS
jgi:hypothetical protein